MAEQQPSGNGQSCAAQLASAQENPPTALFMPLANRTPEEYTIEEISGTDQDNSRTVTMTATINKNNGKDPSIYRFMVKS